MSSTRPSLTATVTPSTPTSARTWTVTERRWLPLSRRTLTVTAHRRPPWSRLMWRVARCRVRCVARSDGTCACPCPDPRRTWSPGRSAGRSPPPSAARSPGPGHRRSAFLWMCRSVDGSSEHLRCLSKNIIQGSLKNRDFKGGGSREGLPWRDPSGV